MLQCRYVTLLDHVSLASMLQLLTKMSKKALYVSHKPKSESLSPAMLEVKSTVKYSTVHILNSQWCLMILFIYVSKKQLALRL